MGVIIVSALIFLAIIFMLVWLCFHIRRRSKSRNLATTDSRRSPLAIRSLIPPVFLTEDMPDPLSQPDFREHVINQPDSNQQTFI
jgi:C4-dicarboxylate-specific signal transduction histidine kinase